MKLPAIQFYPCDWRKDPGIQALSFEERGIWLEILFLMHESQERGKLLLNGKKIPTDRLAKMIGVDAKKMASVIETIIDLGVADVDPKTGALVNRRMVRDEAFLKTRRECGKKGGNPALLDPEVRPEDKVEVKVKDKVDLKVTPKVEPTPSSSSSSSPSGSSLSAPEEIEQTEPPGWEPPLPRFVAECARYSVPAWYAKHRWEVYSTKGWAMGRTPILWKQACRLVQTDFVNDGSPMTEKEASPRNGPRPPAAPKPLPTSEERYGPGQ